MRVKWLARENQHFKLVVEPLNVLLTLKRTEKCWEADCLGSHYECDGEEEDAKRNSLIWFQGILTKVMALTHKLLEDKPCL